jgi:hypothetical protein
MSDVLPPTHPDTLLEMPPVISLLPDIADHVVEAPFGSQKLVHGGDGSTASDLPSAPPISPPSPSVHPHTPPSTYHSLPPDTPLPATPPAHFHLPPPATPRPQRLRHPRDQWLPEQWAVPDRYKLPREPTPAVVSSDEDDSGSDDPLDLIQAGAASTAEPTSYRQSQQLSDTDLWHTACEEEMEAHRLNGTWEIVKLPPGKRAIGSRWFMKVKHNADGSLDCYKSRLVAKGYSQCPGFDFKETFAPTVHYSTIRIVLALAALEDLELRSVDISHVYINGTLEEEAPSIGGTPRCTGLRTIYFFCFPTAVSYFEKN